MGQQKKGEKLLQPKVNAALPFNQNIYCHRQMETKKGNPPHILFHNKLLEIM